MLDLVSFKKKNKEIKNKVWFYIEKDSKRNFLLKIDECQIFNGNL